MSRARVDYSDGGDFRGVGFDPDQPIEGYYRMRLKMGGAFVGVRIWYGAPLDPETGEEMDRSWRWQALVNDEHVPLERAWPKCGADPISEDDYRHLANLQRWARTHAPDSAIADPRRLAHPLDNPLPF
jgi:hypothetical protein